MALLGRFGKAIRTTMGLDAGQVGVLPELLPTIEMQAADAPSAFLRSEHLYSVYFGQVAVAGQYGIVVFRNPATSNKLCCIEAIEGWGTAGATGIWVRMERGGTAAAAALACAARDPRIWSDIPPYNIPVSTELSRGSVAAIPGHVLHLLQTSAARVKDLWLSPVVIVPGTSLYLVGSVANTEIHVNVDFWERTINAEEYA